MRLSSIFLFLVFISIGVFSQNKETLKKQKKNLEQEIKYTSSLLDKTKKNKKSSLVYIDYLDKKINSQERLIQILNIESSLLQKQIIRVKNKIIEGEELIKNRESEVVALKKEYGEMIYALQKNKSNRNNLMFIISSETFNQAYKRVLYLRQYSRSRKVQALQIHKTQDSLAANKERLLYEQELIKNKKNENILLISTKQEKLSTIVDSKQEKKKAVSKLQKSEKIFRDKIQKQQKEASMLEKKIKQIIEEEIRRAREKLQKDKNSNNILLTPEAKILSDKFSANKGSLPWPLEQGLVVKLYGKQKHPVFGNIETFNNGINIATNKNVIIRSVFDGKISRIFFIKGKGKAVLINHGEYFTVYSGLEDVNVKLGDEILAKEKIGTILTDESEERTELHFEIWKGYEKQDPSIWLFEAD